VRDPEQGLTGQPRLPGPVTRAADRAASFVAAIGLERWARLGAVAVVPLLAAGQLATTLPLFVGLAAFVLLTGLIPRDHRLRAADLVAAGAVIVLSGGNVAPFLLFLAVVVAGPAVAGGVKAGLATGGTLSLVLLTTLGWHGHLPRLGLGGALPAVVLLPLVGVATASAAQVMDDAVVQNRLVLQQANRLLSSLQAIAGDIPGGLDVSTVSAAVLAEIRTLAGIDAAIVYAEEHGVLQPTAAFGVRASGAPALRLDEVRAVASAAGSPARFLTPRRLPPTLQPVARAFPHWTVLAIERDRDLVGALMLGFADLEAGRAARAPLSTIADDAALALENARLFDGTRVRAADVARRRVAGDLHDGVAQSLAHLRMELELLAMTSEEEEDGGEIGRLSRVAGSALEDLRATIGDLRRPLQGDLATLLRQHLEDVMSPAGPAITFDVDGHLPEALDPERAQHVLRVAQEAVSNALRHARAAHVRVELELGGDEVLLAVEDDGIGLDGQTVHPGTGVGLRSMQERAEALGGEVEVRARLGGGTVVVLRCPASAPSPSPQAPEPTRPGR
jgi:signal transduction histidine kinase